MPSVRDYVDAFRGVEHTITENECDMLKARYSAPGRCVTMRDLAVAVGYSDHSSANLQYGKLAHEITYATGYVKDRTGGASQYIDVLATPRFEQDPDQDWEWVMRPAVATALEELGWIRAAAP